MSIPGKTLCPGAATFVYKVGGSRNGCNAKSNSNLKCTNPLFSLQYAAGGQNLCHSSVGSTSYLGCTTAHQHHKPTCLHQALVHSVIVTDLV